ncbi:MAG: HDOD domain-containing protein [Desulfobacteraceae bacterium]|nr:MAG: HDOD domain-containing protein [Desulfobacteraceae bacterium]
MTAIQELIKEIKKLKPIPAVINRIIEAVDQPGSSMDEIAAIIKYDPAVTAMLLKTCNSAFFGLKNPAESVEEAAMFLGTDQIVELVLLKSGAAIMTGKQEGYGLQEGAMWKYAVSSALIAKQVARQLSMENINTIFTAALLKDLGKIILDGVVADKIQKIDQLVVENNFSFQEAEKQVIGIDHAELGAMIAKMWKFSPRMVKIIRNHHLQDESMQAEKDIIVVYLADCICMMLGLAVGADALSYQFHTQAMDALGLDAEGVSRIMASFTADMDDVEALLEIL